MLALALEVPSHDAQCKTIAAQNKSQRRSCDSRLLPNRKTVENRGGTCDPCCSVQSDCNIPIPDDSMQGVITASAVASHERATRAVREYRT